MSNEQLSQAPGKAAAMSPEEANYRPAQDPNQSCASCQYMDPNGMCQQLKMLVTPEMLCDLYMPKGETMTKDGRASLEDQVFGGPPNG